MAEEPVRQGPYRNYDMCFSQEAKPCNKRATAASGRSHHCHRISHQKQQLRVKVSFSAPSSKIRYQNLSVSVAQNLKLQCGTRSAEEELQFLL